jgi:hypothetical protein
MGVAERNRLMNQNVWVCFDKSRDIEFISSDEGLEYLAEHFGTVVMWADWYEAGEHLRAEQPWGPEMYEIAVPKMLHYLRLIVRLHSRGIKPIVYMHSWHIQRAGYTTQDVITWAKRMRDRWGAEGLYLDGPDIGINTIGTYDVWRQLRGLFPDGILIAHDSNAAHGRGWHGRWVDLANGVLVGERDRRVWTPAEIGYQLAPTASGTYFLWKPDDDPRTPEDERKDAYLMPVYRVLGELGYPARASLGQLKRVFDRAYLPAWKARP